jgi:hypothetical protein
MLLIGVSTYLPSKHRRDTRARRWHVENPHFYGVFAA